jgi:hypothetical protein
MANELICSVCEQRIVPCHFPQHDTGWAHADGAEMQITIDKDCNGRAVPKAPEPIGDDKSTPLDEVAVNVVDEMIDNLRYSVGKQKTEPKAPDVIEVDLPPSKPTEDDMVAGLELAQNTPGCHLKTQGDCNFAARLGERERQLRDNQIASRRLSEEVVVTRKERDAALAEVERLRSAIATPEIYAGIISDKATCKHEWVTEEDSTTFCDLCGIHRPEPKAPDVIEVDWNAVKLYEGSDGVTGIFLPNGQYMDAVELLEVIKAEIAAKMDLAKTVVAHSVERTKAEKERDAALADLSTVRDGAAKHIADLQETNTQLQRDLDAAKAIIREILQPNYPDWYGRELLDRIKKLLK